MEENTLNSVVVGGLIATLPLLLGLAVQIYIHESEKRQKDREAKIQLALELRKEDMKTLELIIDNVLKTQNFIINYNLRLLRDGLSDVQIREEMSKELASADSKVFALVREDIVADKLAYSFGEEFYAEYKRFIQMLSAFGDRYMHFDRTTFSEDEQDSMLEEATKLAGTLHNGLADKLISIRNTIKKSPF